MDADPPVGTSAYKLKPLMEEFKKRILPLGVVQCVRGTTRSWPGQADSCLDLVFTNVPEKLSQVQSLVRGYSDHKLVIGTRYTKNIKESTRYVRRRSYKNFDEAAFLQKLREISMFDIYTCQNASQAADLLTNKINKILDEMAPVKKIQIRSRYAPWITPDCKDDMDKRDSTQKKAIETGAEADWSEYRRVRNKVTRRIRKEKTEWQKKKLENCEGDPARVWGNILGWLNWSSSSSPSKLYSGGRVETSPFKLANIMNMYYIQKVTDIRSALPVPNVDPLYAVQTMMAGCPTLFELQPVHPDTVDKIIKNLKNSKSCGLDHIDTYVLKIARKEIVPAVTHLVNLSIGSGVFPSSFKISKIAPLYKSKGDRLDPSSYRPVALLSTVSKILERAVYLQIMDYMETNRYFHPNHHGFRSNHSTTTALLQMYDNWMEALERKELAGLALIDMSAAFDCVDTELLLAKLELYGFTRHARQRIWSYMTERSQVVMVDGSLSSALRVHVGVPQGSILGPLLYVIFTNELPEVVHGVDCTGSIQNLHEDEWHPRTNFECQTCGGIVNYADDSSYTATCSDQQELAATLSTKYTVISEYLSANRLKVNDSKTHMMILTTSQLRRSQDISVQVQVGTGVQDLSGVEQLLGLQLHEGLKFQQYIMGNEKSLIKMLNTRVKALQMLRKVANFKTRLMIANGIFMSKMCYIIPVWGGCEEYLMSALQIMQNKALRAVCKRGKRYPIKEMLKETNWLNVHQLSVFHTLMQAKKILVQKQPSYLYNRLVGGNRLRYARRIFPGRELVIGRKPRLSLIESSWRWRAAKLWTGLPRELKSIAKLSVFKSKLKLWVKENVEI